MHLKMQKCHAIMCFYFILSYLEMESLCSSGFLNHYVAHAALKPKVSCTLMGHHTQLNSFFLMFF